MLRITKIADYGFNVLVHMAEAEEGKLFSAKELASAVDLPLPTISKILKILTQGQILTSQQGSKGGYALAHPPQQISAAEIIEVLEGPIAITDCSGAEGCARNCPVGPNWQRINHVFEEILRKLSLEEMTHQLQNSTR